MPSSEGTPLLSSDAPAGDKQSTVYFLERNDSVSVAHPDAAEIDNLPDGSSVASFQPRPVPSVASRANSVASSRRSTTSDRRPQKGWTHFFKNVGKKTSAFAASGGGRRAPPVKIDPKVFFANERTFLAWTHVAVLLAGASVAIAALTDAGGGRTSVPDQLYGVLLLPVAIAFILYAMTQYSRRASLIRRKAPGPYSDIVGPTVLTVVLMLSIVAQFSLKLYTLM